MSKVYIFGDSFASEDTNFVKGTDYSEAGYTTALKRTGNWEPNTVYLEGWSHYISQEYDTVNLATTGSGMDSCLRKLINLYDKQGPDGLKNDCVAFVFADGIGRHIMEGMEERDAWAFKYFAGSKSDFKKLIHGRFPEEKTRLMNLWHEYHTFAETFVVSYVETQEFNNRMHYFMCTLDYYSKYFKKFIVIPFLPHWKKYCGNLNFNFHIYERNLADMAKQGKLPDKYWQDILWTQKKTPMPTDPMFAWPNHLDRNTNHTLYDHIHSFFQNREYNYGNH